MSSSSGRLSQSTVSDAPGFTFAEQALFDALLACCTHYLEWGCGTSTAVAARHVSGTVTSIDSSAEWIARVQRGIEAPRIVPKFVHVDIGPVGAFGYPADESARDQWPQYASAIRLVTSWPDLVLVDGRFRVACALQALQQWSPTLVMVHDYANRPHYHAIGQNAREVARAERLSVFVQCGPTYDLPALTRYLDDPR